MAFPSSWQQVKRSVKEASQWKGAVLGAVLTLP